MTDYPANPEKKPLTDNWLTLFGFILALVFLIGEAILIAADILLGNQNAYAGILIYIVGPSILVFGLLLIPFGMWREHRRRLQNLPQKLLPVFDLNHPRHRIYLMIFIVMTALFMGLSAIGTYQAYHVTESTAFCGLVCHQVMKPEYTAYQHSPHARVACVQCHIGPGADWFVKSKLSGAWQVYAVLTNSYRLPIDTPIENLRPARDTCEQCHWPEKFYSSVEKSQVFYASDDENTPYRIDLLLHVGEKRTTQQSTKGIHWHIGLDHRMEYYATDEDRQVIPWIRVTYNDGMVQEFVDSEVKDFDASQIPPDKIRIMDCIDCHNRPSHHFVSPVIAVNKALSLGRIDPRLPGIKSNAIDRLQAKYETTDQAKTAIETELHQAYEEQIAHDPALRATVEKAIQETIQIYTTNIFPEWNVDWSHYPSNIGHFEFPGCYRCHDDKHVLKGSGQVLKNDCRLCHSVVRQGEGWDVIENLEYKEQDFSHPRGFGDDWQGQNCHECHGPGLM